MSILSFLLLIAVIGFVIWLLQRFVPMPQEIKTLLVVAGVTLIVLILFQVTGILGGLGDIPKLRR